jgi:hypothetical protein
MDRHLLATLGRWWGRLDRGWKASALGLGLLCAGTLL